MAATTVYKISDDLWQPHAPEALRCWPKPELHRHALGTSSTAF